MKTILTNNQNQTKSPLFFGEGLSIQRYDQQKYEKIYNMFKQHLSYFWRPEEVSVSRDRGDFQALLPHEKFIFTKNLSYQILLDSVQSRGIPYLLQNCSNPEIELFAKMWEFSETIHSYSYTYVIKNVYSNPSKIFDEILEDKKIQERATSVTKYYDTLIHNLPEETIEQKKRKLYLNLAAINILEGIRFYVSFACSFSFAERSKMEGNAKIISLIARDENLHMGFTTYLMKLLAEVPEEGFQKVAKDCEELVYKMYEDASNEELDWIDYIFKDGSMIGLNKEILTLYMKHLTNQRLKALNMEPLFDKSQNPISWINRWIKGSTEVQVAPQETEIESYVIGALKHADEDADYRDLI
jgi:ribonucleoside-diphosphate reductase beta chain